MFGRKRTTNNGGSPSSQGQKVATYQNYDDVVTPPHASTEKEDSHRLPQHNGAAGHHKNSRIKKEGESGRSFFHPIHFLHCCFRSSSRASMAVNVLWPVVPAAIAVHFAVPERHVLIFTLNYIAMIPAANLIGYAGQELGRKMPNVFGIFLESTCGSIVEIVLFSVLVTRGSIAIVRAAIIGSILANLLLCLGICFIVGGLSRHEQKFHEVVSEVGSGLLLVAAMGLILPAAFATAIDASVVDINGVLEDSSQERRLLHISRATGIVLVVAYVVYVFFNMSSHHSIVTEVLEEEELHDRDRHKDLAKKKLTLTECILALLIAIACVSLIAVFLVEEIEYIITDHNISEAFMGLILVPLVEKLAEHLTAIDEAYDQLPNSALAHILGATVQTALLNVPIVIFVGWGLAENMDLNFKQFEAIVLILSILVVGNFLRDGKSNYLEGVLMVFVYILIAVCAWYYPNQEEPAH